MKNSPFDFLDSSTYNREQLLQIIDLLYNLLQEREVTVTLQPAPITVPYVTPVFPTYPPLPGPVWNTVTHCQKAVTKTQETQQ